MRKATTKKRNPRYVATDESGYELAFIPAFNAAEALKIAKKRYPGRKLKITKVDEQMYIGRGAKELEAKERQLRRIARAGSRKRNPLGDADAANLYHELNQAGQGFAIGEDYDDIGTASAASGWHVVHRYTISLLLAEDPAGRQFLVGGDGQGRGPWAVSVPRENPRRGVARTVTRRAVARGVVQPRRRNATHIHADKIDHLDVAKIHNPSDEDEYVRLVFEGREGLIDEYYLADDERTETLIAMKYGPGLHTMPAYYGSDPDELGDPTVYTKTGHYVTFEV
jgi:hypothetical protein